MDRIAGTARSLVGEEVFARARSEGGAEPLEAAVERALYPAADSG
ncbi:hypothetical protein ACFWTE_19305 [Nocardiopsis sp. NPDC058631]